MSDFDTANSIHASLRLIDREVWIVTAAAQGRGGGLCATWVSTASIDPERPAMLLGIAPNHFTASLIDHSGEVGLHLLRREQTELALHFAHGSGRNRDKLAGLPLLNASAAPPLLANCLAWFHVRVFARYHAGDRIFYWADVVAAAQLGNSPPLREQELLQSLTAEQRQILLDGRQSDLEQHRPWHHAWRIANPFVPGSVSHTVGGVQ